MTVDPAST
jgi:IPT/TIG domain